MKILVTDNSITSLENVKQIKKFRMCDSFILDIFYFSNNDKDHVSVHFKSEEKMNEAFQEIVKILRSPLDK